MIQLKKILLDNDIVIDNMYLDKYVDLINSNRDNSKVKFKTQKHHVIPRYWYKLNNLSINNSKENTVNLYHYDHLLAHYYLYMCSSDTYKKNSSFCFNRLIYNGNRVFKEKIDIENISDIDKDIFNNILVEANKQRSLNTAQHHKNGLHKNQKICMVDKNENKISVDRSDIDKYLELGYKRGKYYHKENNPNYGKKRSEAFCKHMSEIRKGQSRYAKDPEKKSKKLSAKLKGIKKSDVWRKKISETLKRKKIWTDGNITIVSEKCPGISFYIGRPKNKKLQNRIWINNGCEEKWVDLSLYNNYLDKGYNKGRLERK